MKPLKLFHEAAKRVPAYKDFLTKAGIDPATIKTEEDFARVPATTKTNYIRAYPLADLCWDGTLQDKALTFTATSGSTGLPTYFPRTHVIDEQSSWYHEQFFKSSGGTKKTSTLVIVGFGMGVWIGGMITYQAFRSMAERGYQITLITPGVNKKEIIDALKNLAPGYERVILCGYPPFIKDIIDEAPQHGIDWKQIPLSIVFAAEGFSEGFRDHLASKAHIQDPTTHTANIYGSADIGTMAMETPETIRMRRAGFFKDHKRIPTLAYYNPDFIYFESPDDVILITGDSALPLIRYEIGDSGHVYADQSLVAVYERKDFSTKLYGAIIYPEHVRDGLQHKHLEDYVTGKFTMLTNHDTAQNEFLEIHIEMKPHVSIPDDIKKNVEEIIKSALHEKNEEYRYLAGSIPDRVHPRVQFWDYEHPEHFKRGGKQKWTK